MKKRNFCSKCGNEIKVGDRFCEECGSNVQRESTAPIKMIILTAVILAVVVCVTAYALRYITKPDDSNKEADKIHSTSVAVDTTTEEAEESTTEESTTTEPATTEMTTEEPSFEYPTTVYTTRETTTRSTTAYSTTARQNTDSADPQAIYKDSYYIIRNTPDSAGLSVREKASSSSVRLEIAKEGTAVKALRYYSALDNGYVYVTTSTGITGWVLASYLYPFNPYEEDNRPYSDYRTYVRLRVSYDTPDHAGLNMRLEPSSTSEKLTLVTEGAVVDVLKDYHPNDNGYIFVGYDHPHAGTYYTGWVLVEYLEYYGV